MASDKEAATTDGIACHDELRGVELRNQGTWGFKEVIYVSALAGHK